MSFEVNTAFPLNKKVAVKPVPPASIGLWANNPNPSICLLVVLGVLHVQPVAQVLIVAVLFHAIWSIPRAVNPESPATKVKVNVVMFEPAS